MGRSRCLPIFILGATGLLTACGVEETDNQSSDTLPIVKAGAPVVDGVDYDDIVLRQAGGQRLVQVSNDKFAHLMKNSVRTNLRALYTGNYYSGGSSTSFSSSSWSSVSSSSSSFSFSSASSAASSWGDNYDGEDPYSTLNIRADGVDEPDLAKYDGENWYFLTSPQNYQFGEFNLMPTLQVANLNPVDANAEITQAFELPAHWTENTDLYLLTKPETTDVESAVLTYHSDGMTTYELRRRLAQLRNQSSANLQMPINGQTEIRVYDVDASASESLTHSITVDGTLIDSRKVGDTLYLISRFTPWLDGLYNGYNNPELTAANEDKLTNASVAELSPYVHVNGQSSPIEQQCWVEGGLQTHHAAQQFVYITSIDLREGAVKGSTCYAGNTDSILFTLNSVYFAEEVVQNNRRLTAVHKFSVSPDVSYRASGTVKGIIEHVENPEYLLDEYQDDLRIVTTNDGFPVENYLTVLQENPESHALELVSQIPNAQRPDPIGKPGERVYSVRFEGEKAYIVTFRRTDPLYAIDLSDRTDPKVTGELTIPGYATYMHPVGDNHLFYFGMNTNSNGWDIGLKAELIDVSQGDPVVVSSVLFGEEGSKSEAIGNYRAISIVNDDDLMKFAIPVELFQNGQWQESGIKLLEVSGVGSANATLHNRGMLRTTKPETMGAYFPAQARLRSIIHGDSIFALHNDAIWASFWDTPEDAKGPIFADLDNLLVEVE